MAKSIPARIHVLMARSAPTAVVIRRGPSKAVCTIEWDRRNDKFRLGQWMRGRIYERRADLSADGKYMIYFAMNGRWHDEARGSWTAVSRAPYLKAVTLYPKGDCWNGGGLFTSGRNYWLNDGYGHGVAHESREVRRDESFMPAGGVGNECLGVYFPRLLRDGWTLVGRENRTASGAAGPTRVYVFEKPLAFGWSLRKLAHSGAEHAPGKGCYWDEHELVQHRREIKIPFRKWEWAEVEGSRLVWAESGILRTGKVNAEGLRDPDVLIDLNPMKFEPVAAPY